MSSKISRRKLSRSIYFICSVFVLFFLILAGYFIYYVRFEAPDDINNSYNLRQENLAARVVRGDILAADGQVLATTVTDNGREYRYYPFGELFSHVVGYTVKGKTGIERLANISLLTSNTDFGDKIKNEMSSEKNPGDSVVTALDVNIQKTAYEALGIYKGAIVVMEPKTGRVLAMVSNPGYDPNHVLSSWDSLNSDLAKTPLLNRATLGLYPPGSVFKIVTLLEFYREDKDCEDFRFNCKGSYTEDGVRINCYHGSNHGQLDLKKSFAKSCNSAFASIGSGLSYSKYKNTAEDLLFNKELPLKYSYKESRFSLSKQSTIEERLHTSIGQGKTLITPFHMALITSAIANDGILMRPVIIDKIINNEKRIIRQNKPDEYKRLISKDEAYFLKEYLEEVVKNGTGSKLSGLSYTVAGKTGSAEFGNVKGESHSWFTGYSNIENPELVVTVIVEGAGSGSDYAVPMAKRIFDSYYCK